MFNGNETFNQLIEKIKLGSANINNQIIQVSTNSGSYQGKLISSGSNYLVLELDLRKTSEDLKTKTMQKVFNQQVVLISSITAIQFELLK